jgi:hypothetical protein
MAAATSTHKEELERKVFSVIYGEVEGLKA